MERLCQVTLSGRLWDFRKNPVLAFYPESILTMGTNLVSINGIPDGFAPAISPAYESTVTGTIEAIFVIFWPDFVMCAAAPRKIQLVDPSCE